MYSIMRGIFNNEEISDWTWSFFHILRDMRATVCKLLNSRKYIDILVIAKLLFFLDLVCFTHMLMKIIIYS